MKDETPPVILVIDDEPAIRNGVATAIKRHGYTAVTAEDGNDGLEKARQYLPDLIISDVMMPPPDGFEMKRLMSADPRLASIPFVFLTARAGLNDRVSGIGNGADDYLSKPFAIEELLVRVDALLRRAKVSRELGREEMKEIAQKDMERLQSEILQNFHHELRTPLTNIMLPLQLAFKNKFADPEEQSRFIQMALSNAGRLESLISDIVILSNIEHGNLNVVRQPVDFQDHVLGPIQKRLERYASREIEFSHSIPDQFKLMAPRQEFMRAVLHLVDNAFKFGPSNGKVHLDICAGQDDTTMISVLDEGPGIPREQHEKVFEKFYQISSGDNREHEGLGVGLTIARAIFQSLRGDVYIVNTPSGCKVVAELPGVGADDVVYG